MSVAVSIVIRCRNEATHLGAVLDAVLAQEGAPPFEVLALDSGSRDGTLELLARRRVRVEHLPADTFTFGRALNRGAALACGEIVVFLSAHCRPLASGWLAALVSPFADAEVVATFGRQVPVPGMNPIEALAQARMFPALPPAGVLFSNANGAVRRAAVHAGPFDEDIPAAEDHLWAAHVRPSARIVYVPAAAVSHSHPMTLREWRFRFYVNGLAVEYARRRAGVEMPWGDDAASAGGIVRGRAGAFVRLAAMLARAGEARALAHLPSYVLARTISYTRGRRDGARRYGHHAEVSRR
jgi:glycosyltransferase involved in cell wall biosynthesis